MLKPSDTLSLRSWCPSSTSILKITASTSYQHQQKFWVVVGTLPTRRRRWLQGEHSIKGVWLCILFTYYAPLFSVFLFFLSFPFLPFSFSLSIFCKMSALVRHRISLFGKMSVNNNTTQAFQSFLFFFSHCVRWNAFFSGLKKCGWSYFICVLQINITAKLYLYMQERMHQRL